MEGTGTAVVRKTESLVDHSGELATHSLPVPVTDDQAARHPVTVYLARLAPSGRKSQAGNLRRAARVISGGLHSGETAHLTFPWHRLTYAHLAAFKAWAVDTYPSHRSAQNQVITVRAVLRECRRLGLMTADEYNAVTDIEPVKGRTEEPAGRHVTRDEVQTLLNHLDGLDSVSAVRDAAAVAILRGTGMRRGELLALTLADYDRDAATLLIRKGKGNVKRLAHLPAGALARVEAWLAVRGRSAGALVCAVDKWGTIRPGRHLSAPAFNEAFGKRVAAAGLRSCSPHDMRRSMAGDLLEAGYDVSKVMRAGGWSTPAMVTAYDRRGDAARREMAAVLDV